MLELLQSRFTFLRTRTSNQNMLHVRLHAHSNIEVKVCFATLSIYNMDSNPCENRLALLSAYLNQFKYMVCPRV